MGLVYRRLRSLLVAAEVALATALLAGAGEGLGFLLLRGVTDETSFDDEGPGGRTLRYVKYFSTPSAAEAPAPTEPPAPPVDPAEVVYRPMDPREAVEVSRCAWRSSPIGRWPCTDWGGMLRQRQMQRRCCSGTTGTQRLPCARRVPPMLAGVRIMPLEDNSKRSVRVSLVFSGSRIASALTW